MAAQSNEAAANDELSLHEDDGTTRTRDRMRRLRIASLAVLLPALAGALAPAALAAAPVPQAPVAITACRGGITSVELMEIAAYDVTLRNDGRVAADEIRWSARYGRHEKRATFDLKGTFAPGRVRHAQRAPHGERRSVLLHVRSERLLRRLRALHGRHELERVRRYHAAALGCTPAP